MKQQSREMFNPRSGVWAAVLVLIFFVSATAVRAARPLSQLVDQKAGIYLESTELDRHIRQFLHSPLATRFKETEVFRNWLQSQDVSNLKQGLQQLETLTEQPLLPLLSDLFGESVGLAVFNNGPKQAPSVLLLTTVKDPEKTQSLFQQWFQKTGMQATAAKYLEIPFYSASPQSTDAAKAAPIVYYCFFDRTLIISESEPLLQSSITLAVNLERRQQPLQDQNCLYNLKMYQRARAVLAPEVTGSGFCTPRAWDVHMKRPRY